MTEPKLHGRDIYQYAMLVERLSGTIRYLNEELVKVRGKAERQERRADHAEEMLAAKAVHSDLVARRKVEELQEKLEEVLGTQVSYGLSVEDLVEWPDEVPAQNPPPAKSEKMKVRLMPKEDVITFPEPETEYEEALDVIDKYSELLHEVLNELEDDGYVGIGTLTRIRQALDRPTTDKRKRIPGRAPGYPGLDVIEP